MTHFDTKKTIARLIATFGCIGFISPFPGTLGSLVAFPLSYLIIYAVVAYKLFFNFSNLHLIENELLTIFIVLILLFIVTFMLGLYFVKEYIKDDVLLHDPQEVVVDEVAGQILVIAGSIPGTIILQYSAVGNYLSANVINWLCLFVLPLILFRIFDILKPWPISWADEKIAGSLGIMLDDVLAAIFAIVSYYAALLIIIDLVH